MNRSLKIKNFQYNRDNREILPQMPLFEEIKILKKTQIKIQTAISYAFEENSYIISLDNGSECVIVDPGIAPEQLLEILCKQNLTPVVMLITHGHYDHIGGIFAVREVWPECQIWTSEPEAKKLVDPNLNLSAVFGFPQVAPAADKILDASEEFTIAGLDFQAIHIPGHSSGHLVFALQEPKHLNIFVGDTIFAGSIGRGDFPDGDSDLLIDSIKSKLLTLPDNTILYPGHGEKTTVGHEKRYNPWIK